MSDELIKRAFGVGVFILGGQIFFEGESLGVAVFLIVLGAVIYMDTL